MALIRCPECGKEISDKASVCIGCGFPIKEHLAEIEEWKTNEEKVKEKYLCHSCHRQNEVGEEYCSFCGNRLIPYYSNNSKKEETRKELLDRLYVSENGQRVKMIKALREEKGYDLTIAKEIVDNYWDEMFPTKNLHYTKQQPVQSKESPSITQKEFNGIYRYSLFGGRSEVYCPRCSSENCSHYQEQKIIPGKTKTRYTANLNPLKPFTLVNKKEKVVKREETTTISRFLCNNCGKIFD